MTSLLRRLRRRPRATVIVECRHCGTAVDSLDDACPACGSREIARYEV